MNNSGPVDSGQVKLSKTQKRNLRRRKLVIATKNQAIRAEIDRDEQAAAGREQLVAQKEKYSTVISQYKNERDNLVQQVENSSVRIVITAIIWCEVS